MSPLAHIRWNVTCLTVLIIFLCVGASNPDAADSIIRRSVEANDVDWKADSAFDYCVRRQEHQQTNTYEVMMILGSPYERLVAVNGHVLTTAEQAEQQQKLDYVISQRRHESAKQRTRRVVKYERDRKRDHFLMDQLVNAFNFRLLGEQMLGSYEVYVLKATPRPGYKPPNMQAQALTGMQGELWIEKNTFQWVKVEAEVVHPVSIEGLLARVEPGTRFELEKMPVTDSVWLPKHFAMTSHAKILSVFTHNAQEDETYFDYHESRGPTLPQSDSH